MKVYKYDYITSIAVNKETKNKLLDIKNRYRLKNRDKVIQKLIKNNEELTYYTQEPYDKYNS